MTDEHNQHLNYVGICRLIIWPAFTYQPDKPPVRYIQGCLNNAYARRDGSGATTTLPMIIRGMCPVVKNGRVTGPRVQAGEFEDWTWGDV